MASLLLSVVAIVLAAVTAAQADLTIENEGTWSIETRVRVSACVSGQCNGDRTRSTDELFLPSGATVQMRLQVFSCDITALDYCQPNPRPNGKLKLARCDKSAVRSVLRDCSPYAVSRVQRLGGFERMGPDGLTFTWKTVMAFSVRTQGQTVSVNVVATVNGSRAAGPLTTDGAAPRAVRLVPEVSALVESAIDGLAR